MMAIDDINREREFSLQPETIVNISDLTVDSRGNIFLLTKEFIQRPITCTIWKLANGGEPVRLHTLTGIYHSFSAVRDGQFVLTGGPERSLKAQIVYLNTESTEFETDYNDVTIFQRLSPDKLLVGASTTQGDQYLFVLDLKKKLFKEIWSRCFPESLTVEQIASLPSPDPGLIGIQDVDVDSRSNYVVLFSYWDSRDKTTRGYHGEVRRLSPDGEMTTLIRDIHNPSLCSLFKEHIYLASSGGKFSPDGHQVITRYDLSGNYVDHIAPGPEANKTVIQINSADDRLIFLSYRPFSNVCLLDYSFEQLRDSQS